MFIGGAPYQGKTKLVNELLRSKPEKYKNLSLDLLADELERDSDKLLKYCALMPAEMKAAFQINEKYDVSHLRGNKLLWTIFMNAPMMLEVGDELRNAGPDTVPIVESLFYNRKARVGFYESCKEYLEILGSDLDLDEIPKTLIYFDLGLETSVKRQREDTVKKPRFSERELSMFYYFQELPGSNELPNLDVYVVKSEEDLQRALELFG